MPRKLKIDLDDIITAMGDHDRDVNEHFLDTQTGEYILIPGEVISALEEEDEEQLGDLPDWEKADVEKAREILDDPGERYVEIPATDSSEGYGVMALFVKTVTDDRMKELLLFALSGPKPFRRFRDALEKSPQERDRWYAFEAETQRDAAREWLLELDIEAEEGDT